MPTIRDVADIRMQSQLNEEDRRAIRRSKLMALIGVAAVAVAALLPPADRVRAAHCRRCFQCRSFIPGCFDKAAGNFGRFVRSAVDVASRREGRNERVLACKVLRDRAEC